MPLTLINSFLIYQNKVSSLVSYVYNKLNRTIWFLIWIFTFAWFFSSLLQLLSNNQSFTLSFCYVITGLFGGSYEHVIKISELNTGNMIGVCVINSIVILIGFLLKNALIALFIF